ncbi:hypothetical protein Ahy_B10g104723 isoform B [Arachis hypogaea]|uniref:Reverse transcriptase domain-containing protein n=1 Tax=Arachis hypogaea TaxID=3818 RepID=A0A444X6C6_ARAHY|nr:hypothetical protein Ahy_B10g104723 isoform B [Arachis hypogaea]
MNRALLEDITDEEIKSATFSMYGSQELRSDGWSGQFFLKELGYSPKGGVRLAPTALSITHLLFADSCIIFLGAKEEKIFQHIQILNNYTIVSGQMINLEKSGITFGNQISIQIRVNIEEILTIFSGRLLKIPRTSNTMGKVEGQGSRVG